MDVYSSDVNQTDERISVEHNYIKSKDIAICPTPGCEKFITDVKVRKGSVISIKCPKCKKIVDITI